MQGSIASEVVEHMLDEMIRGVESKRSVTFDYAHLKYEKYGRGACVMIFNDKHLLESTGWPLVYVASCHVQTYNHHELLASVSSYDPHESFVMYTIYKGSLGMRDRLVILNKRDVAETAGDERKNDTTGCFVLHDKRCHYCTASPTTLFACAKCKVTKYCNKQCQTKDWPDHKPTCTSIQNMLSSC